MNTKKIMPTTWLLVAILLMLALHFLLPVMTIIPPWWNLLGIVSIAGGVAFNLDADNALHKAKTTVKPFQESSALVTNGIYEFFRNPMYLGFVFILIGLAILLGSLTPYLVIVAFVILIDRVYITAEERMLDEKFDLDWKVYRLSSRRWL
ncbi:MAG TPA: isoprenylcysteine carboxylmethyltransferase family protein [Longilinea sp.]|nr:isoprenylcysteine carboxylmethyltransferase family protein [Longilinea sp.]